MRRSHILVGLVLLAVVAGLFAPLRAPAVAATPTRVTVWLDWYPNTDHVGLYVAMAKGFFARAGLSVTAQVPSGASDALRLVAHGSGDIAISYEPDVLLARSQGVPVQAIGAIVQQPLNVVLALRSSGITRPRQLVGKTVGIAGAPSDYTDLAALMQADGGTLAQVHPVVVNYSLLDALLRKRVDAIIGAYWTWEALQAVQAGQAVNVLHIEQWGVPIYDELVFAASQSHIAHAASVLRAFLRAAYQGYAYAVAHPAEAVRILLRAPGVLSSSSSLLAESLKLLAPTFHKHGYGVMVAAEWQGYANWMFRQKLVTHPVNGAQSQTSALLP